jgi:hypothetical protein
MSDPKAAMQRAAVDAAFKGVQGVGKGIFQIGSDVGKGLFSAGSFAFQQLTKEKQVERSVVMDDVDHPQAGAAVGTNMQLDTNGTCGQGVAPLA